MIESRPASRTILSLKYRVSWRCIIAKTSKPAGVHLIDSETRSTGSYANQMRLDVPLMMTWR